MCLSREIMRSGLVCLADSQSRPLFCNPVDCMQHFSFPCLSPILRVFSYSCLSNQQCYLSISFSVVSFILPRSPSQHQSLFQEVSSLHQVAKVGSQMLSLKSFFFTLLFHFHQEALQFFAFCHKGGVNLHI